MTELHERWGDQFGFTAALAALIPAFDRLAMAAGYPDRSHLVDAITSSETIVVMRGEPNDPTVLAEVEDAWGVATAACVGYDEAWARLHGDGAQGCMSDAQDLVCEVELPWPWLAVEVFENFVYACHLLPWGLRIQKSANLEPIRLPTPSAVGLELDVDATDPHSSLVKLRAEAKRLEAELTGLQPRGRVPGDARRPVLERNAVWFYRSAVLGESNRGIAKSHYTDEEFPESRRQDVRAGVASARRFLEMTAFRYCRGKDGTFRNSPRGQFQYLKKIPVSSAR